MSKDYSHIKRGMCVPTKGMDRDTYLELVDAFRAAGFDMGYGESDWHLLDKANYYGVDTDGMVMQFSCADSYTGDNGECVVTVDFILNSPKTSSEALQDTLEEKATEVLVKEESVSEGNTGAYKASLTTYITLEVGHMLFKLDKEQAKAIYKDLEQIFEDEIR